MKVNQIATLLNDVYQEIIGESAVIEEDLSNIVDIGRVITDSDLFGKNFENYVGKLIDKVGKSIYVDRVYQSQAPNIMKDSWEYGSVLEKVRCDIDDYEENKEWKLDESTNFDVFKFSKPSVSAKYFNSKTTFRTKVSITKKQMKSAFNSASDMNKFISMIENRIAMKMTLASDALIMRTIVNLIAEKISSGNNVVNLLADYQTATGDTSVTAATALTNKEFLRFASKTIMTYKKLLGTASMLYNNDGYVTFTPAERLKAVFATDFDLALRTSLYADTFNLEFVQLNGYSTVPYWQGSGTTNDEHLKINAIPTSEVLKAEKTKDDDEPHVAQAVVQNGVVAVLFDEYAAMVCNEDPEVTSVFNPEGNFYNYWHSFDASYYNDLGENVVVFIIEDPSITA